MKNFSMTIYSDLQLKRASERVSETPKDGKWQVSVKKVGVSRTDQQRKYYFKCVGIMADDLGYTKEELHEQFLESKFLPLFAMREEENERNSQLERLWTMVKACRAKGDLQAVRILIGAISSNEATKDENAEVLRQIIREAAEMNIQFPIPDHRGLY